MEKAQELFLRHVANEPINTSPFVSAESLNLLPWGLGVATTACPLAAAALACRLRREPPRGDAAVSS